MLSGGNLKQRRSLDVLRARKRDEAYNHEIIWQFTGKLVLLGSNVWQERRRGTPSTFLEKLELEAPKVGTCRAPRNVLHFARRTTSGTQGNTAQKRPTDEVALRLGQLRT